MLYKNTITGIIYPFAEDLDEDKTELFFNSAKDMRNICEKQLVEHLDREFNEFEYFHNMDLHVRLFDCKEEKSESFIRKCVNFVKNLF